MQTSLHCPALPQPAYVPALHACPTCQDDEMSISSSADTKSPEYCTATLSIMSNSTEVDMISATECCLAQMTAKSLVFIYKGLGPTAH